MGDWPTHDGQSYRTVGQVAASTLMTTVAASATANTKGSWVQLVASTTDNSTSLLIQFNPTTSGGRFLVDIGIGAAASEQVLVPNLHVSNSSGLQAAFLLLVGVPAGTRVSARCQAATGSQSVRIGVTLGGQGALPSSPLARVTDYGTSTAASTGTSVDPGASTNTKGSWAQLTASTANPIRHLYLSVGDAGGTALTAGTYLFDVAVGASGSETIILPDLHVRVFSSACVVPAVFGPFPVDVPAGTRLAVRSQSTVASQVLDVAILGVD